MTDFNVLRCCTETRSFLYETCNAIGILYSSILDCFKNLYWIYTFILENGLIIQCVNLLEIIIYI